MKRYRPEIGHEDGETFPCIVPDDEHGFVCASSDVDVVVNALRDLVQQVQSCDGTSQIDLTKALAALKTT